MFDFENTPEDTGFEPLPAGKYPVYVDKVEWKASKSNPIVEYLNVAFKVFGEKYENRVIFDIYNLMHQNEKPRNIAMGAIKKLYKASTGQELKQVNSKEDLAALVLQCRVLLTVGVKGDEYGMKNTVKGYSPLPEGASVSQASEPTSGIIPF